MEVDHVPYIFGSFSRRRHSQEVNKSKRRSIEGPNHSHSHSQPHVPRKKDSLNSMDSVQRARSFSRPLLDIFQRKETVKEETEEDICRRKSIIRLALDDTSPIFHSQSFPKNNSFKKDNGVLKTRSLIRKNEGVQFMTKKNEETVITDYKFVCYWCKSILVEPRVLPCFHTYCTKCLIDIEKNEEFNNVFHGKIDDSGCLVYEPEAPGDKKQLTCPKCEKVFPLQWGGIRAFPPNYIIQHKILIESLNKESTKLLCENCTEDILASHRCTECLINLCLKCTDNHVQQRGTEDHEILGLKEKGITKIHRQVMCQLHPEYELISYCTLCNKVACRECSRTTHSRHLSEPAFKACASRIVDIRDALERSRSLTDRIISVSTRLQNNKKICVTQCAKVEEEIEKFIDEYRKVVEEHRLALLHQVSQVKDEQLQILANHQKELEKQLQDAKNTIEFTDDLLQEGSDVEILTFVGNVLKKFETLSKLDGDELLTAPKMTESVQFLANEIKENPAGNFPLYGVISTQTVSTDHCIICKEGSSLDNLRVHRRCEIILETRDESDNPLNHGGLAVSSELWYRDAGMNFRSLPVHVQDKRDGIYVLSFIPDTPGKLSLSVCIKGQHIKDSPFLITVRNVRPHKGTYHCCSFCSSEGSKDATCSCGGTMPGGYKGCGHGHEGHPGRRHWSCCGNVLENSECRRQSSALYQFTL